MHRGRAAIDGNVGLYLRWMYMSIPSCEFVFHLPIACVYMLYKLAIESNYLIWF